MPSTMILWYYTQDWNTGQFFLVGILDNFDFKGSFMVGILVNFDFGRFHFWLEYWTNLGSGFASGWNTGQLSKKVMFCAEVQFKAVTFGWNTGHLGFWGS